MPYFIPFLIALMFIFASCALKTMSRPGSGQPQPEDFYVGPEASLAALFLLLEPVWDGSSPFVQKVQWVQYAVGALGFFSVVWSSLFARWMGATQSRKVFWACWFAGNGLGLACAFLTVWAKWPVAKALVS